MSQSLARRVRSLEILVDLQTLSDMGMHIEATADEDLRLMLDSYRHNARIGEFDHLRQFIDAQAISVDVGANYGQYAVKLAAESRQCVVIEPIQELAWLEETLPPNCVFFNVAAGAEEGQGTLTIPVENGQQSYALATLGDSYEDQEVVLQQTPLCTLDSILAECCPDERVGFVKIDVEGQETAVLQGARQTLARWQPNIQVEIWQEAVPQTTLLFEELGYRGLFFFDGHLFNISRYDPAIHNAPQNAWQSDEADRYDPNLYVNNFFFVPN